MFILKKFLVPQAAVLQAVNPLPLSSEIFPDWLFQVGAIAAVQIVPCHLFLLKSATALLQICEVLSGIVGSGFCERLV